MDFDDLLHKSAMLVPGKFVSKDFPSQKADTIYFVFKKHYLCKFDPLLLWKDHIVGVERIASKCFLISRLISSDLTWNLYRQTFIWIHFFCFDYSVKFFIISLMDESIAKKKCSGKYCSSPKWKSLLWENDGYLLHLLLSSVYCLWLFLYLSIPHWCWHTCFCSITCCVAMANNRSIYVLLLIPTR